MNAFVLHHTSERTAALRWSSSAATIATLHAALIAFGIAWTTQPLAPGAALPAIMVDLAPVSSTPQPTPLDLAPGPVMEQADASPPEAAEQQAVPEEQIAPTPPQEKPIVEAPPEIQPTPPKPEPAKVVPDAKPAPVKPKHTRADAKKPSEAQPAPRTTASPRAERQALAASVVSAGAAAAIASYNQLVAAHLQRFKQYPPQAKAAGERGVARLSFSLGRNGQVLASRLGGSSGHAALDAETLAMVRRAQPFPAFPSEIRQASMSFSVPVDFSLR
jgi:protein TonB